MSKGIFLGVENSARRVKKVFAGAENFARKVKKAYIGVGDTARLVFSSGGLEYFGPAQDLSKADGSVGFPYGSLSEKAVFYVYRSIDVYDADLTKQTISTTGYYQDACSTPTGIVFSSGGEAVKVDDDLTIHELSPVRWERYGCAAFHVSGCALFAGGTPGDWDEESGSGMYSASVDCYDSDGVLIHLSPLSSKKIFWGDMRSGTETLGDMAVLVGGRRGDMAHFDDIFYADLTHTGMPSIVPEGDLTGHVAKAIGDRILVAGGEIGTIDGYTGPTRTYTYDRDATAVPAGLLSTSRSFCMGISLTGHVFVIGGYEVDEDAGYPNSKTIDVFDSSFTSTTAEVTLRQGVTQAGVVVINNAFLVAGGTIEGGFTSAVDVFVYNQ